MSEPVSTEHNDLSLFDDLQMNIIRIYKASISKLESMAVYAYRIKYYATRYTVRFMDQNPGIPCIQENLEKFVTIDSLASTYVQMSNNNRSNYCDIALAQSRDTVNLFLLLQKLSAHLEERNIDIKECKPEVAKLLYEYRNELSAIT